MPVVPTYDNLRTSVAPMPGPQVGQMDGPARQAAQFGEAVGRSGGALQSIMLDEQQRADQTRIADAMNQAVAARLRLTHDKADGYTQLVGRAALERPDGKGLDEEYAGRLKGDIDAIDAGLGNDQQRRVFRQQAGQMLVQFGADVAQYRNRQHTAYQISTAEGTIATARDMASLESGNPEAVAQAQGAIKAAVYELGRLHGWSAQETLAKTVEQLSPMHASVVASSVDGGRLDYARRYMDQVRAELTPQARQQLGKVLDAGDFEARTQGLADGLWSRFKGDVGAAMTEARKSLGGKDEDAVVQRLKTFDAERVALRERGQKDAADAAWRAYASGGIGRVPASVMAAMDGRDLEALRRAAKADAEAAQQQREVKTDPNIYYALTIGQAQEPGAFAKEDLRRYFDRLSPADRKHFMDLQAKTSKGDGEAKDIATATQQKDAMVKSLELNGEKAGLFMQAADAEMFAAQQRKGSPLNQPERQQVLDRMALQGQTPGAMWGTNSARLFEARAKGKDWKPEWSDDQMAKAMAALKRKGIASPTPQQIDATLKAAYGLTQ